jgi:hypothetical protein
LVTTVTKQAQEQTLETRAVEEETAAHWYNHSGFTLAISCHLWREALHICHVI